MYGVPSAENLKSHSRYINMQHFLQKKQKRHVPFNFTLWLRVARFQSCQSHNCYFNSTLVTIYRILCCNADRGLQNVAMGIYKEQTVEKIQ